MLKKNEECIVEIIDNGFKGEGIAKVEGITVFIDGAIKGEKIKIKILKTLSDFCYGKILEIIEESKYRIDDECTTYKKCGGCDLRHIEYKETLNIKRQIVENCLYKTLNREIKVQNTIGMEEPKYYRNKLQYPVGLDIDNKPVMGVYSSRTHDIIKTEECFIQNKTCQEIANDVFEFIKKNNIPIYNEKSLKGLIRHIIVRIGVKTNEVMLILVINEKVDIRLKPLIQDELIQYIANKYPNIKTIVKNINNKDTNVIMGNEDETIYGDGYIYDVLGDYRFKISPNSFYQVNPIQTEILYNTAIEYIDGKNKNGTALDLYCGIGTIGIFASKYFKKIYGIEIVEQAIKDAKENSKLNNMENIEFFAGDVEEVLPEILEENFNINPDVVFIDPPRKGLDNNTIQTLLKLQIKQIIYISCNPATLARDVAKLEKKYELQKVQPVDMFPYTKHIETISLLNLKRLDNSKTRNSIYNIKE